MPVGGYVASAPFASMESSALTKGEHSRQQCDASFALLSRTAMGMLTKTQQNRRGMAGIICTQR